jgi:hypothetical protein
MAILTGGGWDACQTTLQRECPTFVSLQRPLVSILANAFRKGRILGFSEVEVVTLSTKTTTFALLDST